MGKLKLLLSYQNFMYCTRSFVIVRAGGTGSWRFRPDGALRSPAPGTAAASDSVLAHREFGSNAADLSKPHSVRSNSPGIAYAVLRQVPDRMPDKSAAFANSPSLASRLTLQPYRARSCAALHPGGMRDGASTKSAAKARQVLLRIQGRYGIIGTFQQGTREHFYYK